MPKPSISFDQKRRSILEQMMEITRLKIGHISEQFFTKEVDGQKVTRGPYYLFQRWKEGRNSSRRIPAEELEQLRSDVGNFKRYQELSEQFVSLSEQMTLEEDQRKTSPDSKKNSRHSSAKPSAKHKPSSS